MKKILLVEDDLPLVRMYQVAFKRSKDLEIISAVDGEEGLEKARTENPDLILLDLVLPKKSGFEVLKELKGNQKTSGIPVACLTVLHQEEDKQKCLDLGAKAYFVKTDTLPERVVLEVRTKLGL